MTVAGRLHLWLEYAVLSSALLCVGSALLEFSRYELFRQMPQSFLRLTHPAGKVREKLLGRIEIRRLSLSVPILEQDTEENLSLGATHLDETAALGQRGNTVIAGHRDFVFRKLGEVRSGDEIVIRSERDWTYRVRRTRIVHPEDLSVLKSDDHARLTLITCYPFRYIGSAPRRWVVEAELIGSGIQN